MFEILGLLMLWGITIGLVGGAVLLETLTDRRNRRINAKERG
jgi:hypothetical protein